MNYILKHTLIGVTIALLISGAYRAFMATKKKPLEQYHKKRTFTKTPEPYGKVKKKSKNNLFVIQKHDASHLHYDFRLEIDGVLVSWAIPKGPSTDPDIKRLAVMTEDHPLDYGDFEGVIPEGNYGAGTVMVWDTGTYTNLKDNESLHEALKKGKIELLLNGKKLKGSFALIRTNLSDNDRNWLFFKMKNDKAPVIKNKTKSVLTGRTLKEITEHAHKETKYGKK